ncbi:MAG: hypothetical protein GF334_12655 [Candidatus Altiarchaeales archaeon]|nr:hypothetical protein [Candidatus Altiarchaeales archaeon]
MHIGFTGSQGGMTGAQKKVVQKLFESLTLKYPEEGIYLHHGDCVGADTEAHEMARAVGFLIFGHPPSNDSKRAFCEFDEVEEPYDYLYRNTRIVKSCEILIAAPKEYSERVRSGTWSTIRRGRKYKKKVLVVLPDGSVHKDGMLI